MEKTLKDFSTSREGEATDLNIFACGKIQDVTQFSLRKSTNILASPKPKTLDI